MLVLVEGLMGGDLQVVRSGFNYNQYVILSLKFRRLLGTK